MGHPSPIITNAVYSVSAATGKLEARYPYGNAPGGGTSGGNQNLRWDQAVGFGYGNPIVLSSPNSSVQFGSIGSFRSFENLDRVTLGTALSPLNSSFLGDPNANPTWPTAMADPNTRNGKSMRIWDGSYNDGQGQIGRPMQAIQHLPQTTELRIACTVDLFGLRFPGATGLGIFPSISCWKMFWAFIENAADDYGNGFGPHGNGTGHPGPTPPRTGQGDDNDFIMMNWAGGPGFTSEGNDISGFLNMGSYAVDPQTHWAFTGPNGVVIWIRGDPNNPTTGNSSYFAQISTALGVWEIYIPITPVASYDPTPRPVFSGTTGTRHWWEWLYCVGWSGNYSGNNSLYDPRYQQIEIAADPTSAGGALGMLQISNSSTYFGGFLEPIEIVSWGASNTVVANVKWNRVNPALPVYLYATLPGLGAPVRKAVGIINP